MAVAKKLYYPGRCWAGLNGQDLGVRGLNGAAFLV